MIMPDMRSFLLGEIVQGIIILKTMVIEHTMDFLSTIT